MLYAFNSRLPDTGYAGCMHLITFGPPGPSGRRSQPDPRNICSESGDKVGSELPVLIDRLDGPVELLTESLREEALDGNVELLREHDCQARINVVDLGSAKSYFLVVVLVFKLQLLSLNAFSKLLDVRLELLDRDTLALGLHLARLSPS